MYDPLLSSGPGKGLPHPPSYWKETLPQTSPRPALSRDMEVDVAIIGAGYTGLAAAYFISQDESRSTVVLEANRVGWGASGRNAGFALQSTGRLGAAAMEKRWGAETAKGVIAEFRSGLDRVEEFMRLSGNSCSRTEPGFLKVAHSDAMIPGLRAAEALARTRYGVTCRFIERAELRDRYVESEGARAAIRYDDGFCLNPLEYAQSLADLCERASVPIFEQSPVTLWSKEGGLHLLHTPEGIVRAKQVICAGNAYTPKNLSPHLANRTLPVLTSVIVTEAIPEELRVAAGLKTHQGVMDTRKLKYYYRLLPDHRILFGGRGAIRGKDADNPLFQERLLEALHKDFPALRSLGIDFAWHGWITISLDDVPRVTACKDDPSIYYAMGYSGCGMAYTSQAGKRLSEKVTGQGGDHQLPILNSELLRFPLPWLKRVGQFGYYQYGRFSDWIR